VIITHLTISIGCSPPETLSEQPGGLFVVGNDQAFGLEVMFQHHFVIFMADAGLFVPNVAWAG
jgi:hypothetical protein